MANDQILECAISQDLAQSRFVPGDDQLLVHTDNTKLFTINLRGIQFLKTYSLQLANGLDRRYFSISNCS